MKRKKWFRVFVAISVLAGSVVMSACAPDGAKVFKKAGCLSCHAFRGVGGSICPDLTDVTSRRSDKWIRQQIKDPSVNNPASRMPSFDNLSDREIQAIIDYLKG